MKKSIIGDINNPYSNFDSISCVAFALRSAGPRLNSGVINKVMISKNKQTAINDAIINSDGLSQQTRLLLHRWPNRLLVR